MVAHLILALMSLFHTDVVHHAQTWWTTETSTTTFDARPGDTINVFGTGQAICDDAGGSFVASLNLCKNEDF